MNISFFELIVIISAILNSGIGVYVLAHRPKSLVHISFFLAILGSSVWSLGFVFLKLTQNFALFDKVTLFGSVVMVGGLVFLTRFFPNHHTYNKKYFFLIFIPLAFIAFVIPFDLIIQGANFSSGVAVPETGPLFPFFALTYIGYILLSLFFIIRTFITSRGFQRRQISYFSLGLILFILAFVIFDIILPSIGIPEFNALGPLFSVVLVITTAYAIIRHQLMDIRVVIQRGLIYVFLFSIITLLYLLLLSLLHSRLHVLTSEGASAVSGAFVTLFGIFTVPIIDRKLRRITDKIFFKDRYDYTHAIHRLSKKLNEVLDFEDLLEQTQHNLQKIFRAKSCVYTMSPNEFISPVEHTSLSLDQYQSLYVPIIFKDALVATLIMHSKKSGDRYTQQDMQLLETFSYQMAVALEKARLFKEVEDYSRELEEKVAERTSEIKSLQQAQEQMILDISHNLQTPLTVLKSELALLQEPEQALDNDHFFVFEKSIDSVSDFISKLLNISRKRMHMGVTKKDIDLSHHLEGIVEYLQVIAENNTIDFSSAVEPGIHIVGDEKEIEELVTNIFSNAMKYKKSEGINTVNITLATVKNTARITIEDNGIGIHAEDLPKIFNRFYRVSSSTASKGTGLGLAICKKIVEHHNGTIVMESEYGKWTRCVIDFPLA